MSSDFSTQSTVQSLGRVQIFFETLAPDLQ
jgi:hypothetical protein